MNLLQKMKMHTFHQKVFLGVALLLLAVVGLSMIGKSKATTTIELYAFAGTSSAQLNSVSDWPSAYLSGSSSDSSAFSQSDNDGSTWTQAGLNASLAGGISKIALKDDTFYAISTSTGKLFKSINMPVNWTDITTSLTGAGAIAPFWDIAVATDDANSVAVVASSVSSTNPKTVWFSNDGGSTWTDTGLIVSATELVSAIDVSMDYGGARDIAVGTRTKTGAGKLYAMRTFAPGWDNQNVSFNGDVLALKFSPTYAGDVSLAIVYVTNTGTFYNIGFRDIGSNVVYDWSWNGFPTEVKVSGVSPTVSSVITGDIELPSDFSGQSNSTRRAYISVDDGGTGSNVGVFRADDNILYQIMDTTSNFSKRISSIDYAGSYWTGKILAGEVLGNSGSATVPTWFSNDPGNCGGACSWTPASTLLTGAGGTGYGNAQVDWSLVTITTNTPTIPNLVVNGCPSPTITPTIVGNNIVYTIVCAGGGTYTVTIPVGSTPTNGNSIFVDIKDTNGNNQIQISNTTLPANTTKELVAPRPAGNINLCVTDSPQVTDINPKPTNCLPPGTAYFIPNSTNTFSPAVNHSLYSYDIIVSATEIRVTGLTHSNIEIVPDTDNDGVFDNEDLCLNTPGTAETFGCPAGLQVSVEEVNASVKPNVQGDTALETKVFDMSAGTCAASVGTVPQNWAQIYASCDAYNTQNETISPNGTKGPRNLRSDLTTLGANTGDNLVIVRSQQNSDGTYSYIGFKVLGLQTGETRSVGFELPAGQPNNFIQTSYFTKNSRGVWTGSRVAQTINGSFLQIIMPEFMDWANGAQIYPFTFISDSDFDVDVCLSVPAGYAIVAPGTCSQTLVSNEAKVLEFTLAEVGSPKKFDVGAKMKIKHKGKVHNVDLKIPSYNKNANDK